MTIHIDGTNPSPDEIIRFIEWMEDRKLTKEERKYFGEEEE